MKNRALIIKILAVCVVAIWPIAVDHTIMAKYNYYKALQDRYECYPVSDKNLWFRQRKQCTGDFNGDGKTDFAILRPDSKNPDFGKIAIVDAGVDLFYLDYVYQNEPDEAVLLALNNDSGNAHLVVFDLVTRPDPLIGVFAWDGKQISQIQPSELEDDILKALDAEGPASGTWFLYTFFRKPALFLYYAFFFAAAYWLQLRSRRALLARLRPSMP